MKLDKAKFTKKLLERTKRKDVMPGSEMAVLETVYPNNRKVPKEISHHVGIEVECYTKSTYNDIKMAVFAEDLEDYINIASDGSITPPSGHTGFELRILIPEEKLAVVFPKLRTLFKDLGLKSNSSCGLHVHLDMRKRDRTACYKKLVQFQDILFGMVNKNRWENEYCQYSFTGNVHERYCAINYTAYEAHKTIEVRLHHGTTNVRSIEKWVALLLNAINTKRAIPKFKSKTDVLAWKGLKRTLKPYVRKNFNPEWFAAKDDALMYAKDQSGDDYDEDNW